MIEVATRIKFYHDAAWHICGDVLQDPPPTWEFGLPGSGPQDLVADTGRLTFSLDNAVSNKAGLAGYYTIGHTNAPAWFVDGLPVKVVVSRNDTFVEAVRFRGNLVSARPAAGVFDEAVTEVECQDWMQYASIQKLGPIAIQTSKRADQALTTALAVFAIQPVATSFDAGKETWAKVFDTDDSVKMTMASLFQKLCRNEGGGFVYIQGDGTLRFANRHARPLTATSAFTLDATGDSPMNELDVVWDRKDVQNRAEVKITPARIDSTATTVIWKLQQPFALAAGQVMVVTCPFRDPTTGQRISAQNVVDPLVGGTHIKFGSVEDGSTNDLIANLTFPLTVGGNSVQITLTNTGGAGGYVNFIEIVGKGIYTYEPLTLEAEDATSIAARGERVLAVKMEQITNPNTARNYATSLTQALAAPAEQVERVRFLANFSDDFATAALSAEVNVRFTLTEEQTATDADFFICRLKYEQVGTQLWVEIVPAPAGAAGGVNYFIWDVAGHGWDEGRWAF